MSPCTRSPGTSAAGGDGDDARDAPRPSTCRSAAPARADDRSSGGRRAACPAGHVVHVRLVAERELAPLVPGRPRADPARAVGLGHRLPAPRAGRQLDGVDDLHVAGAPAQVPGERAARSPRGTGPGSWRAAPRTSSRCPASRTRTARPRRPRSSRPSARALARARPSCVRTARPRRVLGRLRARDDGLAVDQHGARAARALGRAPVLHRGDAEPSRRRSSRLMPGRTSTETGSPFSVRSTDLTSSLRATRRPRARAPAAPSASRRR